MNQERNKFRIDITVVLPRALWRRVKYQAWRRQRTAKSLLIEALNEALARWEVETYAEIEQRWEAQTDADIQQRG